MGQEGPPSAPQGTGEVGDLGTGPLVVSGGTQLALPPPFSHSPMADPSNQGRAQVCSLSPLASQASKRLAPQSENRGWGQSVFPFFFFFF